MKEHGSVQIPLEEVLKDVSKMNVDSRDYQYYNQLFKHRTVVFNNIVTEDIVESVILPLKEFEEDSSNEPVKLVISTPGGSVADGLVLCNIIDQYKKPLEIYVYGYAYSMGAIILCAGSKNPNVKKYCYPFSFALLHAGYCVVEGESLSAVDQMEFNKKVDNAIKDYVIANTNITEEEYKANERKQWYLNAEEMKEKGLVDFILGEDE